MAEVELSMSVVFGNPDCQLLPAHWDKADITTQISE